jgi:hypothetical protein
MDNIIILSLRLDWTPERRCRDFGGEEYSESFGECDVFEEGFLCRMRMGLEVYY